MLPQYSESACKRFENVILKFVLASPPVQAIDHVDYGIKQVTCSARLRDAILGCYKNNWLGLKPQENLLLLDAVVSTYNDKILLGTRANIIKWKAEIELGLTLQPGNTTAQNEIEVTSLGALVNIFALIHHAFLKPQPVFYFTSHIPPAMLQELQQTWSNVTVIPDPTTPNKHRFV